MIQWSFTLKIMKRLIFLVLSLLVFTACTSVAPPLTWDSSGFYEIDRGEGIPNYYFQYPEGSNVNSAGIMGTASYQGCTVNFHDHIAPDLSVDMEVKSAEINGQKRESWFKNNVLVLYSGYGNENFVFWVYEEGKDMSHCIDLVDKLSQSFTDRPYYQNDRFGFRVGILADFDLTYMPSGEGIIMKKDVVLNVSESEDEGEEGEFIRSYPVEMSVFGWENVMNYENMAVFISDKYSGYSVEFAGNGVFVNEGDDGNAIRRYFVMSEDKKNMFEAYLKVNSKNYSEHKGVFDEYIWTIEEI